MELWIIKLGGSVITHKGTGKAILRRALIREICHEIAQSSVRHAGRRFIILHGAGSFGHPLVHTFQLKDAQLTHQNIGAFSQVSLNMRQLTQYITESLTQEGLAATPFQASSLFAGDITERKAVVKSILQAVLEAGGAPVLGGDLLLGNDGKLQVISADEIAVICAQLFMPHQVIFASDIDGIYEHFPPQRHDQPLKTASRKDIEKITSLKTADSLHDVTGGMQGKLHKLLVLKDRKVIILNGKNSKNIRQALNLKKIGTEIAL